EVSTNPASPESVSVTVTVAATGSSLWFGGQRLLGLTVHVTTGGVLSMLMLPTVAGSATLPALSMHVPVSVTDCPAPSVGTVWPVTVFVSSPDCTVPVSAQVKLTTTSVLFQSLVAAGLRLSVITGFVLSIHSETEPGDSVLPALSRAK